MNIDAVHQKPAVGQFRRTLAELPSDMPVRVMMDGRSSIPVTSIGFWEKAAKLWLDSGLGPAMNVGQFRRILAESPADRPVVVVVDDHSTTAPVASIGVTQEEGVTIWLK